MKRFLMIFPICLVLALSLSFSAFAADGDLVVDNADLLTATQEDNLREILSDISEKQNMDVVVVTTNTLDGKTPEAYADDYYDYNGYKEDGCLLLVSMEDRDWYISTKGYGITAVTDYGIRVLEELVVPDLSNGDYYDAFVMYASTVDDFASEARDGNAYDVDNEYMGEYGAVTFEDDSRDNGEAIFVSLVVALVVAFVIVKLVKNSYRPVQFSRSAANYLMDGSLRVTQQYDHFLYSTVSKVRRESNSGSGGSSTHTSSSGSSHGGGGGKF